MIKVIEYIIILDFIYIMIQSNVTFKSIAYLLLGNSLGIILYLLIKSLSQ